MSAVGEPVDPTPREACVHGCVTVCPECDPRAFYIAYAKTNRIITRAPVTDEEIEAAVDKVLAAKAERERAS